MKKILLSALLFLVCVPFLYSQAIIDSIAAPGPGITGLAWDGAFLWVSSTRRDSIFQVDPANGTIISGIAFAIEDDYGGLAWDEDSSLWIANRDSIFQLDPVTGALLGAYLAPGC
jgi:hypothetical protein